MRSHRFIFIQGLLACLAIVGVGCSTKQLDTLKQKSNAGDYVSVAQESVSCEEVDDVCGQAHLIKGDACFRLAKQQNDPEKHYDCAATELDKGIRYTKTWEQGGAHLNRPQTYANLCESLRASQDMMSGARADQLTQRLLDASQRFLAAEPGNPAAVYYNTSARYTQLRPEILHPRNPQGLCRDLNGLVSALDTASPRAQGTDYQANFARLQSDINGVKRTIAGCN